MRNNTQLILGLVVFGGVALYFFLLEPLLKRLRARAGGAAGPVPSSSQGRAGKRPYPVARLVELPGLRLIDLRGLPEEDLRLARVEVVLAQLRLERPLGNQVWVIDPATAEGWLSLTEVALGVVAGRLQRASREGAAGALLHVHGRTLSEDEGQRLQVAGFSVVVELANVSSPPRSLESLLGPAPARFLPSDDDCPVPASTAAGDPLLGLDLVTLVTPFAFVDLRRAHPRRLAELTFVEPLRAILGALPERPENVIWVVAPWVLEALPAGTDNALLPLLDVCRPSNGHRLAVVTAEGERFAGSPIADALARRGLTPVAEALSLRTALGTFQVPALTLLEDAYLYAAWRS